MGNAILKISERTKDRSGISNSRNKDERKRSKCGSEMPKSDNRINPKPVENVDKKRLHKENTRSGSLNKNASTVGNEMVLKKRIHIASNFSKTNGHKSSIKSGGLDQKRQKYLPKSSGIVYHYGDSIAIHW